MPETEPLYFKEFRKHIDHKFDVIDERFDLIDERFSETEKMIRDSVEAGTNEVGLIFKESFDQVFGRLDDIELRIGNVEFDMSITKDTITKIEAHIGRYEIRAQNIEEIVLQDHKQRIVNLEKVVFAA